MKGGEIKIRLFSRSKERLNETPPVEVAQTPELRGPQVPKIDALVRDRDGLIATLSMGHGKNLEERVREKFPDATEDEVKSIIDEVEARRKALW